MIKSTTKAWRLETTNQAVLLQCPVSFEKEDDSIFVKEIFGRETLRIRGEIVDETSWMRGEYVYKKEFKMRSGDLYRFIAIPDGMAWSPVYDIPTRILVQ